MKAVNWDLRNPCFIKYISSMQKTDGWHVGQTGRFGRPDPAEGWHVVCQLQTFTCNLGCHHKPDLVIGSTFFNLCSGIDNTRHGKFHIGLPEQIQTSPNKTSVRVRETISKDNVADSARCLWNNIKFLGFQFTKYAPYVIPISSYPSLLCNPAVQI